MNVEKITKMSKDLGLVLVSVVLTIVLTFVTNTISGHIENQQSTNEKLIKEVTAAGAYAANAEARAERVEQTVADHIKDFEQFEKEARSYWRRSYYRPGGNTNGPYENGQVD